MANCLKEGLIQRSNSAGEDVSICTAPPSLQDAAFAVEISLSPLACEVPSPPSLPPAVDCSFEAQTVQRKYPDLSNIGFPALVDEAPCWTPQPLRLMAHECVIVWYTHMAVFCIFGTQCLPVVSDGLCSRMIDSLLGLYWVLFTRRRVIWGDFDKVWQNTGDGFALGKLYLMGRQGWREWSFSVYHTSITMIVSVCFASIKLFSSYSTDWSHSW